MRQLYLVDNFKSCVIDVIGEAFHHVWSSPRISNLPHSTNSNSLSTFSH